MYGAKKMAEMDKKFSILESMWNNPQMEDWNKAKKHYWEIESVKKNEDLEKRLNDPAYVRDHIIEGLKDLKKCVLL